MPKTRPPYAPEFRRQMVERVRAGQAAAKAKGKTWGGSTKGWHCQRTQAKILVVLDLLAKGTPTAHIAKAVGISRKAVYGIIAQHKLNEKGGGA